MPENRRRSGNRGSFKPGVSGCPGGRPKLTGRALEVRAACREASVRAVERLRDLLEAPDPSVVLKAAEAILRRAWGEPGTEAEVRGVDTERAKDAELRERGCGASSLEGLMASDGPPPDVD